MNIKLIAALGALALFLVIAIAVSLLRSAPQPAEPPSPAAPESTIGPRAAAGTPGPATPSPAYRLAGTVVGDVQYAVIEAPDGTNDLYAVGGEVPGLGKLVAIRATSAVILGSDGEFELELLAAPTTTPSTPVAIPPSDDGFYRADDDGDDDATTDEFLDDAEFLDEEVDPDRSDDNANLDALDAAVDYLDDTY